MTNKPDALDDRELFKTWAIVQGYILSKESKLDSRYDWGHTCAAWEGFKAGRASIKPAMSQWQPIETAPQNTPVLTVNSVGIKIRIFRNGSWFDVHSNQRSAPTVTHWMHLPLPPTEVKE